MFLTVHTQLFLCKLFVRLESRWLYCIPQVKPECLCRPGVLGGNMGNYPWLADSWPTTNLVHSGKEAVNCCTTTHDTAERYYNGRMLLQQNSLEYRVQYMNVCFCILVLM